LVCTAFAPGEGGFGFDEAAFDGGFEDGGFVALEVGLDAVEVGDGLIEAGELLFDFRDDAFLFLVWRTREVELAQELKVAAVPTTRDTQRSQKVVEVLRVESCSRLQGLDAFCADCESLIHVLDGSRVIAKKDDGQASVKRHLIVIRVSTDEVLALVDHRKLARW
jgi:hypothetical protein